MQFIDLLAQYHSLKKRIDERIQTVLSHGQYISGPEVNVLEKNLAEYVGVKHAITCGNGTDALTLALIVLGTKKGDAIFCPTFTFFATGEVVSFANATPVFVDSEESTFNICPVDLEKRIKQTLDEGKLRPKAIISVDLFGLPANYPEIEVIAKKYNLPLIEDAAQGFGGEICGKRAGSFGDIATTSFFPAKPLGCYGDGGAIFTNNDSYAELLRSLCVHGKGQDKYDNVRIGMNSRLDTIQASILLEKLAEFPTELIQRNRIATYYEEKLSSIFKTPKVPQGYLSSWAQYTLIDENRDQVITRCKENGIPTMVYYTRCLHQQTAYSALRYKDGSFPVAERLAKQVVCLPMHPYMSQSALKLVTSNLINSE